jgi:hypothetical protein
MRAIVMNDNGRFKKKTHQSWRPYQQWFIQTVAESLINNDGS